MMRNDNDVIFLLLNAKVILLLTGGEDALTLVNLLNINNSYRRKISFWVYLYWTIKFTLQINQSLDILPFY